MDLNTKDIYRKNSREIFKSFTLHQDLNDVEFDAIFQKVVSISVNPIRHNVFLMLANQLFLFQRFQYSFQCYKSLPMGMLDFFELMSYLDTTVLTGQVLERKQIINFSIEKIVKEKRINLIGEFVQKLKALKVSTKVIQEMLSKFVLLTGDSNFLSGTDIELLDIASANDLFDKIDYWKTDENVINSIIKITKEQYENLNPATKDKLKFHCLNRLHRNLIADIASFDWVTYINFCLAIGRAIGYEEVNRIIFDFNVPIEPVKVIELKSLKAENDKMEQVEKVMGEIGLSADFEEEAGNETIDYELNISDVVKKIELGLSENEKTVIQSIAKTEATQALEYIKFLEPSKSGLILDEIESDIQTFKTSDDPKYIREQVNRAYIFIKTAISAKEFGRAFKMMDYVISGYPLSRSELKSFVRLKRELKAKWKEV
jgi:hypothetical protein